MILGHPILLKDNSHSSDLSRACQILIKLDLMKDLVIKRMESSENILQLAKQASQPSASECLEMSVKVAEITSIVLETVGYGTVILPPAQRLHLVKLWLPFIRNTKPLRDSSSACDEDKGDRFRVDEELWQSLESAFVSIILALPSEDQALILTEWLANEHNRYPDLTEPFQVWCYRTKVTKRRLTDVNNSVRNEH